MNTQLIRQSWEEKNYTKILGELPPLKKLTQFQKPVQKELINLWAKVSLHASQEKPNLTHFKTGVACTFSALENPIESLKAQDPQGLKEVLVQFLKERIEDFETKKVCKDKSSLLKFLTAEQEALQFLKQQIVRFPEQYERWVHANAGRSVLAVTPYVATFTDTSGIFFGFLCNVLSDEELKDLKTFLTVARFSPYALALYCILDDDAKGAFSALIKQPFNLNNQKTKLGRINSLIAQMIFFERGFKEYTELNMHCTKLLSQAKDFLHTFPEVSERFDAIATEDLKPHELNAYASFLEKVFKQCDLAWLKTSLAKLLALKAQNIFNAAYTHKNPKERSKATAAARNVLEQARELDFEQITVQEVKRLFDTQDFIDTLGAALSKQKFARAKEIIQDRANAEYQGEMVQTLKTLIDDLNEAITPLESAKCLSEDASDNLKNFKHCRQETYRLLELLEDQMEPTGSFSTLLSEMDEVTREYAEEYEDEYEDEEGDDSELQDKDSFEHSLKLLTHIPAEYTKILIGVLCELFFCINCENPEDEFLKTISLDNWKLCEETLALLSDQQKKAFIAVGLTHFLLIGPDAYEDHDNFKRSLRRFIRLPQVQSDALVGVVKEDLLEALNGDNKANLMDISPYASQVIQEVLTPVPDKQRLGVMASAMGKALFSDPDRKLTG
jgi:hypothetical protein